MGFLLSELYSESESMKALHHVIQAIFKYGDFFFSLREESKEGRRRRLAKNGYLAFMMLNTYAIMSTNSKYD